VGRIGLLLTAAGGIGLARRLIAPLSDRYDASFAPRAFEELSWGDNVACGH
jgi:hypothetical protein